MCVRAVVASKVCASLRLKRQPTALLAPAPAWRRATGSTSTASRCGRRRRSPSAHSGGLPLPLLLPLRINQSGILVVSVCAFRAAMLCVASPLGFLLILSHPLPLQGLGARQGRHDCGRPAPLRSVPHRRHQLRARLQRGCVCCGTTLKQDCVLQCWGCQPSVCNPQASSIMLIAQSPCHECAKPPCRRRRLRAQLRGGVCGAADTSGEGLQNLLGACLPFVVELN